MKKQLLLILLLAGSLVATAQQRRWITNPGQGQPAVRKMSCKGTREITEILIPRSFTPGSNCAFVYPPATDRGGYITGNNGYGDKEKMMACRLDDYHMSLPAKTDTIYALFSHKHVAGNGVVQARVYACDANGKPGALLGSSAELRVATINTSGVIPVAFGFASPVTITTEKFYVSVDFAGLYATGDTLALLNVEDGCADTDTSSAWERWEDNRLISLAESWPYRTDLAIFPSVLANGVAVQQTATKNDFAASCYPVPAKGNMTVCFTGQEHGTAVVMLKDITGKVISRQAALTEKGEAYRIPFEVSNVDHGIYFIEVVAGDRSSVIRTTIQ